MCGAKRHVRFTPESDRKSRHGVHHARRATKGVDVTAGLRRYWSSERRTRQTARHSSGRKHCPLTHLAAFEHHPSRGLDAFSQIVERLRQFLKHLCVLWIAMFSGPILLSSGVVKSVHDVLDRLHKLIFP